MGATTPSEKFSATVSTAALVTPAESRLPVSRPTMRATAVRACSTVPFVSASYTRRASTRRSFAASACQHHSVSAARASAGWICRRTSRIPELSRTVPAMRISAIVSPAVKLPRSVLGNRALSAVSRRLMQRPIRTTG